MRNVRRYNNNGHYDSIMALYVRLDNRCRTLASSPGRLGVERRGKKRPGIHCLRMRQNVPKILVHRKLFSKPLRIRLRNPQLLVNCIHVYSTVLLREHVAQWFTGQYTNGIRRYLTRAQTVYTRPFFPPSPKRPGDEGSRTPTMTVQMMSWSSRSSILRSSCNSPSCSWLYTYYQRDGTPRTRSSCVCACALGVSHPAHTTIHKECALIEW